MVTGCGCHDPAVFGHQRGCALGMGPRVAGGLPQRQQRTYVEYDVIFGHRDSAEVVTALWSC